MASSYGGGSSDEVADDYRRALEDLTMNSRYEISNLTVIAKENTEHAMAISEALKAHIRSTAPGKKLPAFYVLDSVVKNVGTPYTLFFGRQLFSTFMEAYARVDQSVRRKMEEMLKTWKEPVPGSIDSRPVFPPDVTRPIENALIKHRTSAIQAQQEYSRREQNVLGRVLGTPGPPYRNTPTPPNLRQSNGNGPYGPPQAQQYPPQHITSQYGQGPPGQQQWSPPYPNQPSYQQYPPSHPPYQAPPPQQFPPPDAQPYQAMPQPSYHPPPSYQAPQVQHQQGAMGPGISLDTLNNDIENLIVGAKAEFGRNPWDSSCQDRLKTLLQLQSLLSTRQISPSELALVREQVAQQMSAQPLAQSPPAPPAPVPVAPVAPAPALPAPAPSPQQLPPPPHLNSVSGQNDVAALLAARQSAATPQIPVPTPPPAAASTPDPTSLLEQLRAAGILPSIAASTSRPARPHAPVAATAAPASTSSALPFAGGGGGGARPALAAVPNDVELKAASLKRPRPELIACLHERLGVPCTQCGRRFPTDEAGRARKSAHMDWHFRVHQRMPDAEKRGQHRSWYVDEMDWIRTRESADDRAAADVPSTEAPDRSRGGGGPAAAQSPPPQYLPVPDDPALANSMCPICREKFETKWLDDAQDWVWMDARRVGDRVYHATCHAAAKRDGGSTPDPVLGKRKAFEADVEIPKKIKTEPH